MFIVIPENESLFILGNWLRTESAVQYKKAGDRVLTTSCQAVPQTKEKRIALMV